MALSIEPIDVLDIASGKPGPKHSVSGPGLKDINALPPKPDLSRSTDVERMLFNRAPNPAFGDQRPAETKPAEAAPHRQPASAEPSADPEGRSTAVAEHARAARPDAEDASV